MQQTNIQVPKNIKLTYFDTTGRAEVIRLILQIGKVPFTDQRLTREQFAKLKSEGTFKYGQIPVLEVDGVQFAQSKGITLCSAMLAGLYPNCPIQVMRVEQVLENFEEIFKKMMPTFGMQDEEEKKKARENLALNDVPLWLQRIDQAIAENNNTGFIAGDKLSYGDIQLYTQMETFTSGCIKYFPDDIADKYLNIKKVVDNVASNPQVIEWYQKNPKKFMKGL